MMTNTDGGPAFPINIPEDVHGAVFFGMSLRDWFAGQALVGLHASADSYFSATTFAQVAYQQADAMLAARKQGGE